MIFDDLKELGDKQKRVYLIFIILLITGFSLVQFELTYWPGLYILLWISSTSIIYFIFSLILKDRLRENAYIILPLSFLLAYPLQVFYTFTTVGMIINSILFIFAILYWIFFTALFTMDRFYTTLVDLDEKIQEQPKKSINYGLRIGLFIGGFFISTILIIVVSSLFLARPHSRTFYNIVSLTRFFTLVIIWFFFIIGIISLAFNICPQDDLVHIYISDINL
jgi:hypothetical protein